MEHGAHRELLPGRRTDNIYKYTPRDTRDSRQGRSRRETGTSRMGADHVRAAEEITQDFTQVSPPPFQTPPSSLVTS
jgi:hypothetical protein